MSTDQTLDEFAADAGEKPRKITLSQRFEERPDILEEVLTGLRRAYTFPTIAKWLNRRYKFKTSGGALQRYFARKEES